ncbi:hypothetical protein SODALDRAFT_320466 [Sodiomyces alkalinus F11]|uniref:Integral membrane protein n=1 Tax=Sodiomyces alkalinus (strain CBS 110278 / VKM F-3762 / F11) TaxID=1314773 RepID=A0A3N2PNJ2_SODAK|nr:hypothetical protein SODALDRAFT_320466 [Sodiomyces alkalinus F11]ROT36000.1 hypothetical protein SODALDRAFT_320466 [Sodiomyces alkalinus F11]
MSSSRSSSPKDSVDVLPEVSSVTNPGSILTNTSNLTVRLRNYRERHSIVVDYGNVKNALTITLNRTIRVPDNKRTNGLPPSRGTFPLFKVRDYPGRLPHDVEYKGGLFFPMYQREAMWIEFSAEMPFAVKIFVGGVNAISGFPVLENDRTRDKRRRMLAQGKSIQDYVVLPEQPWLDGVVSRNGSVRQFVAQPQGSGFAVEAQVYGEERVGGIQIEIVPPVRNTPQRFNVRFEDDGRRVTRVLDLAQNGLGPNSTWRDVKGVLQKLFHAPVADQALSLPKKSGDKGSPAWHLRRQLRTDFGDGTRLGDVFFPPGFSTLRLRRVHQQHGGMALAKMAIVMPDDHAANDLQQSSNGGGSSAAPPMVQQLGLAAGGLITQTIVPDPYPADAWDTAASVMLNLQILDTTSFEAVTGRPAPPTPISASSHVSQGLHFYDIWDEAPTGIVGNFSEVKSVAEMMRERALAAGGPPPEEEPSVSPPVVTLFRPDHEGGNIVSFEGTFRPLEVLRKEIGGLKLR